MKIIVCIDDTDNLESRGTGQLSQLFAEGITGKGWGRCSNITRHQLFVNDAIPYTSHNSAMCFEASIDASRLTPLIDFMKKGLETESAPGSDPGLCVVVDQDTLDRKKLTDFGNRAKKTVLNKVMAYELAESLGIHLSEHGGTGDGIIGALAGTGLRLGGNDGRFRGWYHFARAGSRIPVKELLSHAFVDQVAGINGETLSPDQSVVLGDDKVKIIYKDGRQILPVEQDSGPVGSTAWVTLSKDRVKQVWP